MSFPYLSMPILRHLEHSGAFGEVLDPTKDIILITGGSNGLGKQLVQCFHNAGITVIVFDSVVPAKQDDAEGDNIWYFQCDISNKNKILEMKQIIDNDIGPVTVLINNAGIMRGKPLTELSFEEIETMINVNLLSNFYIDKIFLPDMIENKRGYIVTVASVLGYMSPAKLSAYGASKSGVIALHESLTYELGSPSLSSSGIRTLLIAPGQLRTSMFEGVQTPSELLAPKLDPSYVANIIFQAVNRGRRGEIKIPLYGNFLPIFRALPWRITEVARYISGIDSTMRNYTEKPNESTDSISSFSSNDSET
ncbi:short-chain dehydrogenase/reductase [Saccharomycopsis crataegensis]|uniref:Short-chain dehydrogenase/reductase n=1 Tax=Saccharomycopsis crataegensis TaxID=43959 RepID=A0AAV5QIL8_9ASCO|nr:short-chain dehydrogenase/reductase [Saccharomycopsis crataegensis]